MFFLFRNQVCLHHRSLSQARASLPSSGHIRDFKRRSSKHCSTSECPREHRRQDSWNLTFQLLIVSWFGISNNPLLDPLTVDIVS